MRRLLCVLLSASLVLTGSGLHIGEAVDSARFTRDLSSKNVMPNTAVSRFEKNANKTLKQSEKKLAKDAKKTAKPTLNHTKARVKEMRRLWRPLVETGLLAAGVGFGAAYREKLMNSTLCRRFLELLGYESAKKVEFDASLANFKEVKAEEAPQAAVEGLADKNVEEQNLDGENLRTEANLANSDDQDSEIVPNAAEVDRTDETNVEAAERPVEEDATTGEEAVVSATEENTAELAPEDVGNTETTEAEAPHLVDTAETEEMVPEQPAEENQLSVVDNQVWEEEKSLEPDVLASPSVENGTDTDGTMDTPETAVAEMLPPKTASPSVENGTDSDGTMDTPETAVAEVLTPETADPSVENGTDSDGTMDTPDTAVAEMLPPKTAGPSVENGTDSDGTMDTPETAVAEVLPPETADPNLENETILNGNYTVDCTEELATALANHTALEAQKLPWTTRLRNWFAGEDVTKLLSRYRPLVVAVLLVLGCCACRRGVALYKLLRSINDLYTWRTKRGESLNHTLDCTSEMAELKIYWIAVALRLLSIQNDLKAETLHLVPAVQFLDNLLCYLCKFVNMGLSQDLKDLPGKYLRRYEYLLRCGVRKDVVQDIWDDDNFEWSVFYDFTSYWEQELRHLVGLKCYSMQ